MQSDAEQIAKELHATQRAIILDRAELHGGDEIPRAATAEEIAERKRKCWHPDCARTARLEWCGWRYCLRHFYTMILRDAPGLSGKLVKLRFTHLVRHGR